MLEEIQVEGQKPVHIVMASYNGEAYLEEQLESLLHQSYADFTLEICDDGSTDGTLDILERYAKEDERISIHRNEKNMGYVKNFMQGIKRSQASYIMLCDQDDIWNPNKIEITLKAMKKAENETPNVPLLVFTDAMNYDSDSGEETGRFHKNSHLDIKKVDTAHIFMENKCIGCTVMINQAVLSYLSELPEQIRVHDWWLALICSHFGRIVYVDEPTLKYRQHGGNMIGGSSFSSYVKERLAGIARQREALRQTFAQGAAFYGQYGERMGESERRIAAAFAGMEQAGWFLRRKNMFCYGFTKSGWIRNVGLFFLI